VLGRVVDEKGAPVENAVVSLDSLRQGDTTHGSPPEGTDPLAVTDARGEFFLSSRESFDAMNLETEARRFARKKFNDVRGGPNRLTFAVTEGAALTGRVLKDGKPLPGVALGVVSQDRSLENFTGDFVIGTKDDGYFLFSNLPPGREYYLYGIMNSFTNYGGLASRSVRVDGDGSTKDVGELKVAPGVRLAGQVNLADGSPVPPHTRLSVSSEQAWDVLAVGLSAEGRFDVPNIPAGTYNVSARIKGYRLAEANASFDPGNPFRLLGQLKADKTNLTVLMEPGLDLRSEQSASVPGERPQDLPLAGIEENRRVALGWTVRGRVTDAETGEPLGRFRVTPGRRPAPHSPSTDWQYARSVQQSNGGYQLDLSPKGGVLLLQAEADGYLPVMSEALLAGATGWDFKLAKGFGPSGVVLSPEGKPAAGAQVLYLGPGEQTGMRSKGELSAYNLRPGSETRTADDGQFRFAPKLGECEIIALSSNGWLRIASAQLATNGTVAMQAWARVSGRLMREGQPVTGEHVDLKPVTDFNGQRPWVNFHGAITDDEGRFTIERVPPGSWHLTTRIQSGYGGWTNQRQHQFTAEPGQSVDVGTIQKTDAASARR
jgi:hypothetical protein